MEKNFDENGGFAMPEMTIMPPVVVNVDGPPLNVASEEIASEEIYTEYEATAEAELKFRAPQKQNFEGLSFLSSEIEFTPPTKESYDGSKHQFLHDDEEGKTYRGDVPERFKKVLKGLADKPVSRDPEDEFNIAPEE